MKKIEIIIPDRELQTVGAVLKDNDIEGMSYYRIEGKGKGKAQPVSIGRGTMQYTPEFIPRTKVEIVVRDDVVDKVINNLLDTLDDKIGGKIFISEVQEAISIRTKARGESAI